MPNSALVMMSGAVANLGTEPQASLVPQALPDQGPPHVLQSGHALDGSPLQPPTTTIPVPVSFVPAHSDNHMGFISGNDASLEIILPSDSVICRGVGTDIEPALLSGQVVLKLGEATNIKEVTLELIGKVKPPRLEQGRHR